MKTCSSCKNEKPLSEFHKDKSKRLGVSSSCKVCATSRSNRWYDENKVYFLEKSRVQYSLNPSKWNQRSKLWREKNTETKRTTDKAWREENKEAVRANKARRKAIKRSRSIPYCDEMLKLIEIEAHDLAIKREAATGFKWHVDHIVPLISRFVCGLHNECNLAVIPAKQNIIKGNRHWPGK
jgi:hypothetical protein